MPAASRQEVVVVESTLGCRSGVRLPPAQTAAGCDGGRDWRHWFRTSFPLSSSPDSISLAASDSISLAASDSISLADSDSIALALAISLALDPRPLSQSPPTSSLSPWTLDPRHSRPSSLIHHPSSPVPIPNTRHSTTRHG